MCLTKFENNGYFLIISYMELVIVGSSATQMKTLQYRFKLKTISKNNTNTYITLVISKPTTTIRNGVLQRAGTRTFYFKNVRQTFVKDCKRRDKADYIHTKLAITSLHLGLLTQFFIPLMLCVLILYISGGTYGLKSTTNDRFLKNFSWQFYLLSQF